MSSWEIKLQIKFSGIEYKAMCMGKDKAAKICARMDSKLAHITEGSTAESATKPSVQDSVMVQKASEMRGPENKTQHSILQLDDPATDVQKRRDTSWEHHRTSGS